MTRPARRRALTWLVAGLTPTHLSATLRFATRREADAQAEAWRASETFAEATVRWLGEGPEPTDPDAYTELPFPPLLLRTTELVNGDRVWTGPTVIGPAAPRGRTWPITDGSPPAVRTVDRVQETPHYGAGSTLRPTHLVMFTDGTTAATHAHTRWRATDPEPTR